MSIKVPKAACKCGAIEMTFSANPSANAVCFCNGCRLAGEKALASGGDGSLGEAGGKHCVIFKHSQISISKGADQIGCYKMTASSDTRRFYCKQCNSDLGMAPTALPMIAVSAGSLKPTTGTWGPIQARHSLKETGKRRQTFNEAIAKAPTQVPVVEGLFAPCCSFLCPMICAKTCCCCCNKSTIPEFTAINPKEITEITFANGICDDSSAISTSPTEVDATRN